MKCRIEMKMKKRTLFCLSYHVARFFYTLKYFWYSLLTHTHEWMQWNLHFVCLDAGAFFIHFVHELLLLLQEFFSTIFSYLKNRFSVFFFLFLVLLFYLQSLGILGSAPAALLILSLFGLLLYLLTRCCDRKPRTAHSIRSLKVALSMVTILCCGAIGLGKLLFFVHTSLFSTQNQFVLEYVFAMSKNEYGLVLWVCVRQDFFAICCFQCGSYYLCVRSIFLAKFPLSLVIMVAKCVWTANYGYTY